MGTGQPLPASLETAGRQPPPEANGVFEARCLLLTGGGSACLFQGHHPPMPPGRGRSFALAVTPGLVGGEHSDDEPQLRIWL